MTTQHLLEQPIIPDFNGFRDCILRKGTPNRVFFIEFYQDPPIKEAIAGRFNLFSGLDSNAPFHYLEKEIAIQRFLGYDMIQVPGGPAFSLAAANDSLDSVQSTDKVARGPIQSWKDFEEYKWPSAASLDTRPLEWLEKNIPDGMKCYVTVPVGYYKFLFGIESLFYLIYDEPELVSAVLTKLQNIYVEYCSIVSQFSCVGALWSSDDMGFKTQTLLPPDFIKQNILPVHRACAEIAHQNEKLFFLHSCGNLSSVMDAIIGIGIDAKHSFEDQILPVEQAKALYGDKIALLGGLDMDFLCRAGIRPQGASATTA